MTYLIHSKHRNFRGTRVQIHHEIREVPPTFPYIAPWYQKGVTNGHVCHVFIPYSVWSTDTCCMCLQSLPDRLNTQCIVDRVDTADIVYAMGTVDNVYTVHG
jgi:hypothetical protein